MFILSIAVVTLLIPALLITWLVAGRPSSRVVWLLHLLLVVAGSLFVFQVGAWAFTSYYLRYLVPAALLVAAVVSYRQIANAPWIGKGEWTKAASLGIPALILVAMNLHVLRSDISEERAINLEFPLRNGVYYILQGGSSRLANPFHAIYRPARFALDIAKLNRLGARANGLAPAELEKYTIYGEAVFSPCAGRVTEVVDGLPDNIPPAVNTASAPGNRVVLDCGGVNVGLLHLKLGSVRVRVGGMVVAGSPIGQVGNSGNSSEPHLHLQATASGEPVAMHFDGRFLTINDLVQVPP